MPAKHAFIKRLFILSLLACMVILIFILALNLLPKLHANSLSQHTHSVPQLSDPSQLPEPIITATKMINKVTEIEEPYMMQETLPLPLPELLPVLMYHHIDEQPASFVAGTITPEQFALDMALLQEAGYTTLDTKDLRNMVDSQQPWPNRPLLLTIDDGYASVYEYAYPVLKERGMKAIAAVIGSSAGRDTHLFNAAQIVPHFSWDQAREMQQSGWIDIQSHSFDMHNAHPTNPALNGAARQPDETIEAYIARFTKDAQNNRAYLEEHLPDHRVVLYAYPYGRYNEWSEQVLRDNGYLASLSVESGVQRLDEGLYAMKRINRKRDWTSQELMIELEKMEREALDRLK